MTLMYHIIVNKKSRSGRGEKLWPVIEGELERRRTEFRVYPTKYHGSARETAARLTAKGSMDTKRAKGNNWLSGTLRSTCN